MRCLPEQLTTWGDHIKRKRILDGLLQRDVAEALGTSAQVVMYYERGHATPDPRAIGKIVAWLGYCPLLVAPATWGEKVARAREWMGLTQRELVQRLNISKTTLACWETGRLVPTPDLQRRLEAFLDGGEPEVMPSEQGRRHLSARSRPGEYR